MSEEAGRQTKVKETVACMLTWFKEDPKHWVQGNYGRATARSRQGWLNVGRIELLERGWHPRGHDLEPIEVQCTCIMGAFYLCRGPVEASYSTRIEPDFVDAFHRVVGGDAVGFNDAKGRKVEEVIEALEKVHAAL